MKIHFQIAIDDVIAMRQAEYFNSARWNWVHMAVSILFFGLMQFPLFIAVVALDANPLRFFLGVIPILSVIAWILGVPKMAAWIHAWWIKKAMRGRRGRFDLGQCEMELRDWSLIVTTELMQVAFDFRVIHSVVDMPKYTLIRINAEQFFVIPKDRFPEHEFRLFVAELREYWENRHSGPPTVLRALRLPRVDARIQKLA